MKSDGIYISCQPTGSSEEETMVSYSKNPVNYNMGAILNNPIVLLILQILVGCIVFIIVFYVLNYSYNYLIFAHLIFAHLIFAHLIF